MKRASAFDKLDTESKAPPQLKDVPANPGAARERNSKLLLEFESLRAETRAVPVLRDARCMTTITNKNHR